MTDEENQRRIGYLTELGQANRDERLYDAAVAIAARTFVDACQNPSRESGILPVRWIAAYLADVKRSTTRYSEADLMLWVNGEVGGPVSIELDDVARAMVSLAPIPTQRNGRRDKTSTDPALTKSQSEAAKNVGSVLRVVLENRGHRAPEIAAVEAFFARVVELSETGQFGFESTFNDQSAFVDLSDLAGTISAAPDIPLRSGP